MRPFDVRSVAERDKYYGPIDGVCPVDYPDTYYILTRSHCVRAVETIYVASGFPWKRLCRDCHLQRGQPANFMQKTSWHSISIPIWRLPLFIKTRCSEYDKVIAEISDAEDCRECIEQFLICRGLIEFDFYRPRHREIKINIRHF